MGQGVWKTTSYWSCLLSLRSSCPISSPQPVRSSAVKEDELPCCGEWAVKEVVEQEKSCKGIVWLCAQPRAWSYPNAGFAGNLPSSHMVWPREKLLCSDPSLGSHLM